MDIDPNSSVCNLMVAAAMRIDGKVMYLTLAEFFIVALVVGGVNVASEDYSFAAWKVVISSLFMMPLVILMHFSLASFSSSGDKFGRWFNAVILFLIPVYFFLKML